MSILNTNSEVLQLLTLLRASFTEKDNAKRKEAEAQLKIYESNLLEFIKLTTYVILTEELNHEQSLRLSVVVYLKNQLKTRLNQNTVKKDDCLKILEMILPMCITANFTDVKVSSNVNELISIVLSKPDIQDKAVVEGLINFLTQSINKTDINILSNIMNMTYVILSSPLKLSNFTSILGPIRSLINILIEICNELLGRFTAIQNEGDIEVFIKLINMKKQFFESLFLLTIKLKKNEVWDLSISEDFINTYLDQALSTILFMSNDASFISFTEQPHIDSSINLMKSKALMWLSLMIQNEGAEIKNNTVYEKCFKLFTIIAQGFKFLIEHKMAYLGNMSKDEKDYPDNEYNTIIFQSNLFISRLLVREPVVSNMNKHIKEYVLDILFPLLITTKMEYIRLKSDGEDHHNFHIDLMNDFVSLNYINFIKY